MIPGESERIHGTRTALRPATLADVDQLTGWLADPEVHRWWGGQPVPRAVVQDKYIGERPGDRSFIVETAEDAQPIGYIQYWLDTDLAASVRERLPPGPSGGIDLFLIPAARSRGLGPDAARALVRYLLDTLGWARVTVDPAVDNPRAHRAWAKAGFAFERELPDHPDGPSILMAIGPGREPDASQ